MILFVLTLLSKYFLVQVCAQTYSMRPMNTSKNKQTTAPHQAPHIITGEKYLWNLAAINADQASHLADACSITRPIAEVLVRRGFTSSHEIFAFLCMTKEIVADARKLKGAEQAVDRILQAIEKNEKILIFGDYDVDGITSSAIMLTSLLPLGADINYFLPNRRRDGYGLSSKIVKKAAEHGYKLIVTVDNGISAHQAVQDAKDLGLDVIITDHHQPHGDLPIADVIVNPHQADCPYPYKEFAGVGVIFKIMDLLYKQQGKTLPEKSYELLMLGTIADVVPLKNENRFWVQHGLAMSNKARSTAMKVLMGNGKLLEKREISSRDIGFMIAPQLNALGRLDDPRDGVTFLISKHYDDVMRIGQTLKMMNEERKRIDRGIYQEVEALITQKSIDLEKENLIMAAHTDWPAGVIGLVAGKLMQNYGRPAILFHITKDGTVKGSCRSIPAFNMFEALEANKDLLISFGGHACAAGLSLKQENVALLKQRLEDRIAQLLTPQDLTLKINLEACVDLSELGRIFMNDLRRLEPFGNANPEPTFLIQNVRLLKAPRLLKDKHVKCTLFSQGIIKDIMFFNRPDLYDVLLSVGDNDFSVAATVVENEWNGRVAIELHGVDIAQGSR